MLIANENPSVVEADLTGSRSDRWPIDRRLLRRSTHTLAICPGTGHPRVQQQENGPVVRPRRARCQACKTTHVLLQDGCLPRHRDNIEVIGSALVQHATGARPPANNGPPRCPHLHRAGLAPPLHKLSAQDHRVLHPLGPGTSTRIRPAKAVKHWGPGRSRGDRVNGQGGYPPVRSNPPMASRHAFD